MTVAIDRETGEVVGQVPEFVPSYIRLLPGSDRIVILTHDGYKTVAAASVRLEILR